MCSHLRTMMTSSSRGGSSSSSIRRVSELYSNNVRITQLSKSGRLEDAIAVFRDMRRRNGVSYNAMVSAYGNHGRVDEARRLFDGIPSGLRTSVSYNAMLAVYARNGLVEEISHFFHSNIPSCFRDAFTYTILITSLSSPSEAMRVFDSIVPPHHRTPACFNALLSVLSRNGCLNEALQLLQQMPNKNSVSYNSVLGGYTRAGDMRKAIELFQEMKSIGGVVDLYSWNLLLHGFVKVEEFESARKLFDQIPNPNVVSWVTILDGYAKAGRLEDAKEMFDRIPIKNVVAWNAMIAGYTHALRLDEALKLFEEMPERNFTTWTTIIDGYGRAGRLHEAKQVLATLPCKNVAAQTALLNGYVQRGNMEEAQRIFDRVGVPDVVCWNTMISGYAQCGRMDEALELFLWMPKKDVVSWNTMISGYAQKGDVQNALKFFDGIGEIKSVVSWNSIIAGFSQNGFYLVALRHLISMRIDGKRPDSSTLSCVLSSCANLAALNVGEQLHALVFFTGYGHDLSTSNALINMYSKCGRMRRAKQVFNEIVGADIISWNSLIAGYAFNGYGKETLDVYQNMIKIGLAPDAITFVGVLSACCHAGMIEEGIHLFNSITGANPFAVELVPEHYACTVDLLGRSGKLEEAYKLVKEMPIEPSASIWGALLGACRIHKNIELAKMAAEKLLEFEPHKTSNYVVLSNMLAEEGRWDEVDRIRGLMRERGVQKQPGCSWVEIKNEMHMFLTGHPTQPRVAKILDNLAAQIGITWRDSDTTTSSIDCG